MHRETVTSLEMHIIALLLSILPIRALSLKLLDLRLASKRNKNSTTKLLPRWFELMCRQTQIFFWDSIALVPAPLVYKSVSQGVCLDHLH